MTASLVIPYWFILTCIAVAGIFLSGYAIGKDEQSNGTGIIVIWLGPLTFLCFALLLSVIVFMV